VLLLEAGRAPKPPLAIAHAWRREATAVSHLGAVPRRVLPRVRTPSTLASFSLKTQRHRARRALKRSFGEPPITMPH
jgi:hypothetical protein